MKCPKCGDLGLELAVHGDDGLMHCPHCDRPCQGLVSPEEYETDRYYFGSDRLDFQILDEPIDWPHDPTHTKGTVRKHGLGPEKTKEKDEYLTSACAQNTGKRPRQTPQEEAVDEYRLVQKEAEIMARKKREEELAELAAQKKVKTSARIKRTIVCPSYELAFYERRPLLYRDFLKATPSTPLGVMGVECPDSWRPALEHLSDKLELLIAASSAFPAGRVFAAQVKEKCGSLRFYLSRGASEEMLVAIGEAAEEIGRLGK